MTNRKAFSAILSFLLILALLFSSVSCAKKPGGAETDPVKPSDTEASSEPSGSEPDESGSPSEDVPVEEVTEEALLSTGFPLIHIEIDESKGTIAEMNQDPEHETRCYGEVRIDIPKGYSSEYENKTYTEASSVTYALDYIRGRGNSTWSAPKKPYKMKLDKKADLFGMGADKNWALLANYYDCTMIRNKMTYSLGKSFLPEGTFVPESVFVHVMMNGEYLGLYILSEDIRFGKARIDLEEPSTEENASESALSGGYLLMTELFGDKGRGFRTDRNSFQIDTPDSEDLTEAQYNYISNYMRALETAIYEGGPFTELLDLDSYIDYYLIEELSGNRDGYRSSSTYLFKDKDDRLVFGPLWDFDYVSWSGDLREAEGFVNADYAPWFEQFLHMDYFKEKLLSRWETLKELMLSYCEEGGQIDRWAASLRPALAFNDQAASTYLWDTKDPYGGSGTETLTEEEARQLRIDYSFDNELARLKAWILNRVEWLDEHFSEIRPAMCAIDFKDGSRVVKFQKTLRDEALTEDVIPVPEIRKGYRFTGWYREDPEAGNVPLSLTDSRDLDADYLVYQAGWEEYDASQDLLFLGFSGDRYYVPVGAYLDLQDLISVAPLDFEKAYLDYEISMEPSDCAYLSDTALMMSKEGEISVTVRLGNKEASCRLTVVEEEAFIAPVSYTIPNSISMKAGAFLFLPLEPNEGAMLPARQSYEKPDFSVLDSKICEIDPNGLIHALSKGTVTISVYDSQTNQTLLCVLTVK
ncbi:MAG: CotH kinase family protein [Lachnospiraceae bacterium]|nr:CotH kinase family protein [Lachnospiraceae bacterium]